ncbi:SIR2 family protein [Alteromonas macleodii]|jgi:hypothetical protein|uniref:SIR2 family protein n=1 Tax=Alteromonas macleodii TaxID=28108 RepID=UPI00313D8E4D
MEQTHDPFRHLTYLRQSLSQDSESIGFFISAGCPLSVKMPEDKWPLIPDVAGLTNHIKDELRDDELFKQLINELDKAGKNSSNVEDILSFIRSLILVSEGGEVRGFNTGQLKSLEAAVCTEIVKKIDVELPTQETPYHRLGKWIRSIDRKHAIEIFTTNYDLLLEQALEELEIPYFDGFVGARKPFFDLRTVEDSLIPIHWSRLWKIHGSINWHLDKKDSTGEITSVYRTSSVKKDSSHLIYPSHLKYEESRKMPYLALIDQLSRFVRNKSSLLILSGYSFNDFHLNDAIVNALKSNPTGMVLALMYGNYFKDDTQEPRYPKAFELAQKQHNLNIWTFDKAVIGTNVGNWKPQHQTENDAELAQFIELVNDEENEQQSFTVRLGDFDHFSKFLKTIIGHRDEQ